jgi:hypothetical protein
LVQTGNYAVVGIAIASEFCSARTSGAAKLHPRTVFGSLGAPGNSILGKVAEENASPAGVAALVLNTCSS